MQELGVASDIFDVLKACAEHYKSSPSTRELRDFSTKFIRCNQVDLFRILWKIPQSYNEFPSLWELEKDIFAELNGTKKLSVVAPNGIGKITPEMLARTTEELVASGVDHKIAEKGKELIEHAVRLAEEKQKPKPTKTAEEATKELYGDAEKNVSISTKELDNLEIEF
jgi:hypothetical protein